MDKDLERKIEEIALSIFERESAFTSRKLTDTPNDSFSVTPRKYVNLNGTTAERPTSSVVGQFFFDNTLGRPIWWDGTSFVDADGNTI